MRGGGDGERVLILKDAVKWFEKFYVCISQPSKSIWPKQKEIQKNLQEICRKNRKDLQKFLKITKKFQKIQNFRKKFKILRKENKKNYKKDKILQKNAANIFGIYIQCFFFYFEWDEKKSPLPLELKNSKKVNKKCSQVLLTRKGKSERDYCCGMKINRKKWYHLGASNLPV